MCFGRCDIGTVQTEDFTATSEQVSRPTLCAHWANETWIRNSVRGHKAPKIGWGISGIPCVPGTLSSWNPRFRNLGTTHSVYWNPGFAEPRRADLLSRCPPPVSDCSLTGPFWSWNLGFLANWFSGTLSVAWYLGTTHVVYPTPGLFPEPRNLARTLTSVPVRNLWHNPGSISKLWVRICGGSRNLVGTQCCWNLARILVPQTLGLQDVSKLVFRWFQNFGTIHALAARNHGKVPGTLSKAKCARNLPGTLTSRNPKGSQNPLFPEPCLKVWFAEPWVPGTLPRTLVPGTLGSREPCPEPWFPEPVLGTLVPGTGETRRQGRAVPRSTPEGYVGWDPKAFCCWGKKITFMTDQNSFCAIGCRYSCVACFQWELLPGTDFFRSVAAVPKLRVRKQWSHLSVARYLSVFITPMPPLRSWKK